MWKSRLAVEQIVRIACEVDAGAMRAEVPRRHGISRETLGADAPRAPHVLGMELADAQRLKGLEEENRRRKKLVAGLSSDDVLLKEMW